MEMWTTSHVKHLVWNMVQSDIRYMVWSHFHTFIYKIENIDILFNVFIFLLTMEWIYLGKEPKKTFSYLDLDLFSFNHVVFFSLSSSPLSVHSYIMAHSSFHFICIMYSFEHMDSRHPKMKLCLWIMWNVMN